MTRLTLTAGALAAALVAGAAGATAADLDYGRVPLDRYSSAYEDPRYRDLYGPEPRAYAAPAPHFYRGEPPPPVPPAYVYRDNDRYPPDRYPPNRYDDGRWRQGSACLPHQEIKRRLVEDGWRDFHDLDLRQSVAKIHARRPSGDLFALKIDRCTGEIVHSQMIQRGGYGPYAYDNGPRRWERPYY